MHQLKLTEGINLLEDQNRDYKQPAPVTREEEALLLVIDASVHDLNQPMTVILGLSELLLSQVEPDSPFAEDLSTIVEEARRMGETIRGLSLLTHYETMPPAGSIRRASPYSKQTV
jgi:signal transduction histidine kinase